MLSKKLAATFAVLTATALAPAAAANAAPATVLEPTKVEFPNLTGGKAGHPVAVIEAVGTKYT